MKNLYSMNLHMHHVQSELVLFNFYYNQFLSTSFIPFLVTFLKPVNLIYFIQPHQSSMLHGTL